MVETSYAAITKLAKDIANGIRAIETLNSEMKNKINRFRNSFQYEGCDNSEGFDSVRKYIVDMENGVEKAKPHFDLVIDGLLKNAGYRPPVRF